MPLDARRTARATAASGGAGTRAQRRRLAPDERERQILEAAIAFFAEVGFGGQTRELSRRLGITQPLLYRYFPSKRDLIERVYRQVYIGHWDPEWERLLDDHSIPLRARLIEFYGRYTRVIFNPQWLRIYLYSGLLGVGFNRRYIARLEHRVLGRICRELRHELGLPGPERVPIGDEEMELVFALQSAIFYYGVRKHVYRMNVRVDAARAIEIAVDALLEGAPGAMRRLVAGRRRRKSVSGKGVSGKGVSGKR